MTDSTVSSFFSFVGHFNCGHFTQDRCIAVQCVIWLKTSKSYFYKVHSGILLEACLATEMVFRSKMGFWKLSVKLFQDAVGPKLFSLLHVQILSYKTLNIRYQVVIFCTNSSYKCWFSASLESPLWWNSKLSLHLKLEAFFFLTLSSYLVLLWYFPRLVNWGFRTLLKALL